MISAQEALIRLKEGNQRFVSGTSSLEPQNNPGRCRELVAGQQPFAVVVGCADSRVPVEMIFDQGLGDLFVIRVAGNVAGPIQLGSIEYAVQELGTRLVVVLGHTNCGAVGATLAVLQNPPDNFSPNLGAIVTHIQPAVEGLLQTENNPDRETLEPVMDFE